MNNKFIHSLVLPLLSLHIVFSSLFVLPAAAGTWSEAAGGWKYIDDSGSFVSSCWIEEGGRRYYIDSDGIMYKGWLHRDGSWYYLQEDGSAASGIVYIRGVQYSFDKTGVLSAGPGSGTDLGTSTAPNVSAVMCNPDFWINRIPDAGKTLLDQEQITDLNRRILEAEGTNINDLENLPERFNGIALRDSQAAFASPKGLYLNGQPVPESYYEAIRSNIRGASVSSDMPLSYGFAVNRTLMKAWPYSEFLSDGADDPEWDNAVNSAVRVNDPLVIYYHTADGRFAFVKNDNCSGWVPAGDIAICRDKAEWLAAGKMDQFIVVTGEKVYLEAGTAYPESSEKCLTMGTVLELVNGSDERLNNRVPWNSYVVKLPHRNDDGSFSQRLALIPANRDVHVGWLSLSRANIITQAFKCLGNRYGWGGMLNSQDCSGFVMDIYRCFGLSIPRNTTWQSKMPVNVTDISGMSDAEKSTRLDALAPGSIIQFPGHEMIYLGCVNGRYYTINDVSSLVSPLGDPADGTLRVRSVIVNDLSTMRKSGHTWLNDLSKLITVW